MIPRRDISIYGGLTYYLWKWFLNIFKRKDYGVMFRRSLQRFFGVKDIFLLARGRIAIDLILESVDFNKGDEIIVPNYYLKELVPNLKARGLEVVFCDISPKTLSLDENQLKRKITDKTRFVMLAHMFGYCGNVEDIVSLVRKKSKNIVIIEDCAHAFGSEYKRKKLGTFGDFSLLSFDYIKPLNLFGGGALMVNNGTYRDAVLSAFNDLTYPRRLSVITSFRYYIFQNVILKTPLFYLVKLSLRNPKLKRLLKKIHKSSPYKTERLSTFQSLLGYYQLKLFPEKMKELEEVNHSYRKNLSEKLVRVIPGGCNSRYSNYSFFILLDDAKVAEEHMFKAGVDIGIQDEVMDLCVHDNGFPVSEKIYKGLVQLPFYTSLSERKIKKIAAAINKMGDES